MRCVGPVLMLKDGNRKGSGMRGHGADGTLDAAQLGAELGERATLVQFS